MSFWPQRCLWLPRTGAPNSSRFLYARPKVFDKRGDSAKAHDTLREALALDPNYENALQLALCSATMGSLYKSALVAPYRKIVLR